MPELRREMAAVSFSAECHIPQGSLSLDFLAVRPGNMAAARFDLEQGECISGGNIDKRLELHPYGQRLLF